MLTRSAATGFGGTSCRSQLSNSTTVPAATGIVTHGWFSGLAVGRARRRRHVAIEPRVLELQARHALRRAHVVRAADRRQRVQVQAVRDAPRHHVDPAIRHRQLAAFEVELERACA